MGNAPTQSASTEEDTKGKHTSGGRVEISLLKNNLEAMASPSTAPAAASQDQPAPAK
jgi:hypothetical protein